MVKSTKGIAWAIFRIWWILGHKERFFLQAIRRGREFGHHAAGSSFIHYPWCRLVFAWKKISALHMAANLAGNLVGKTINGWLVQQKVSKDGTTGGNSSSGYVVRNDSRNREKAAENVLDILAHTQKLF